MGYGISSEVIGEIRIIMDYVTSPTTAMLQISLQSAYEGKGLIESRLGSCEDFRVVSNQVVKFPLPRKLENLRGAFKFEHHQYPRP